MHKITHSRIDLLVLIFLVGFCSLVYEIYSVRVLFMFFVKSTHAASIAISSFLAGIAFSSLIFSRFSDHNQRNLRLIFWLQIASAIYGYFILSHYEVIPDMIDALKASELSETVTTVLKAGIVWLFLFVPAFFMGGAFPLVNGLYLKSLEDSSRDTGTVYFWDTLGAIFGALLTGFLFIPLLGLEITLLVPVALNLFCALIVIHGKMNRYLIFSILLMLVIGESLRLNHVDIGIDLHTQEEKLESRFGKVLFQKESEFGRVVVTGNGRVKQLYVDYQGMCQSNYRNIAESTVKLLPEESDILSIGFGCGFTSALLGHHSGTSSMDVVEINPVVIEVANRYFRKESQGILEEKNVNLHIEDGYEYIRNTTKLYDAIVVDIEAPTAVYSSAFFTVDFLEAAKEKLKPGGFVALWSYESGKDFTKILYNSFKQVFPYVAIENVGSANHFFGMTKEVVNFKEIASLAYQNEVEGRSIAFVNSIANPIAEQYYDIEKTFGVTDSFKKELDVLVHHSSN